MIMKWIIGTSAVIGLAILTLGLTLVFTGSLATENRDDTRELASALVTDGNGMSEGIQVHGDWTIEVSDPDGTLVERRQFKNALTSEGTTLLTMLLTSNLQLDPDDWFIALDGKRKSEIQKISAKTPMFISSTTNFNSKVLTKETTLTTMGVGFTLSGSNVLVEKDEDYILEDTVTSVRTMVEATTPPSTFKIIWDFTNHVLEVPLVIQEDQKVNVTVQISFE